MARSSLARAVCVLSDSRVPHRCLSSAQLCCPCGVFGALGRVCRMLLSAVPPSGVRRAAALHRMIGAVGDTREHNTDTERRAAQQRTDGLEQTDLCQSAANEMTALRLSNGRAKKEAWECL